MYCTKIATKIMLRDTLKRLMRCVGAEDKNYMVSFLQKGLEDVSEFAIMENEYYTYYFRSQGLRISGFVTLEARCRYARICVFEGTDHGYYSHAYMNLCMFDDFNWLSGSNNSKKDEITRNAVMFMLAVLLYPVETIEILATKIKIPDWECFERLIHRNGINTWPGDDFYTTLRLDIFAKDRAAWCIQQCWKRARYSEGGAFTRKYLQNLWSMFDRSVRVDERGVLT